MKTTEIEDRVDGEGGRESGVLLPRNKIIKIHALVFEEMTKLNQGHKRTLQGDWRGWGGREEEGN